MKSSYSGGSFFTYLHFRGWSPRDGALMQCALFFAGLWGVFLFKESKGLAVVIFFVSGAVLLAGAILLTLSVGKA